MTGDVKTKVLHLPDDVDIKQVESALDALTKYADKKKDDSLFMDAPTRILLDILAVKTPLGKNHFFNIRLPHSPYPELTSLDVLLVVPDVPEKDPDHVVGEVKDVLLNSTHADKIRVREVMTFKQFRDDYSQFEAKRALAKSVDVVVTENKIRKMIPGILGREFFKQKKFPLFVPGRTLKQHDLGAQIWFELHKTVLNVSLKGRLSTIVVGYDTLTVKQLSENMKTIISWISKNFPGKWSNIEKLSLHLGEKSMPPLPIFMSSESRARVTKRPKTKGEALSDEEEFDDDDVSTQLGKRIKITSKGDISVVKPEIKDEIEEELADDD